MHENGVAAAAAAARDALLRGRGAVVFSALGRPDRELTARSTGEALAEVVAAVVRQTPVRRVIACGGDTSSWLVRSLGVDALLPLGAVDLAPRRPDGRRRLRRRRPRDNAQGRPDRRRRPLREAPSRRPGRSDRVRTGSGARLGFCQANTREHGSCVVAGRLSQKIQQEVSLLARDWLLPLVPDVLLDLNQGP